MKMPTLPRICATLIFCLYSLTALSQIDNFQNEYNQLANVLASSNKEQATILIPKIRALYLSIAKNRTNTQSKLDQNLKLYKEPILVVTQKNVEVATARPISVAMYKNVQVVTVSHISVVI